MIQARNLAEFETAYRGLQNPFFNLIYADRDGHILYLFGGRTPQRAAGGWDDWQGVVPGDSSANLWTETHPYEDLPRVVDPPSGWVQNANDPPWTSTWPPALNADDFPAYMAPREMAFRPQRSVRMLLEDDKISFDELLACKMSTRSELADRLLDDLIPAAKALPDSPAAKAAAILEAWDRAYDSDSRGAVLFAEWARGLRAADYSQPWREDDPLKTPDGLKDPKAAAEALAAAADRVSQRYGSADVAWGQVYRLHLGEVDLPANGGPGSLGIFRVVYFQRGENNRYHALGGDSYVALVEFGEKVVARALVSAGNASQPGSPHRGDQLSLFAEKKLRPVWRTRAEVEDHLEKRESIPTP
jgi:acyl-homoserine-lactone acylase